jgi:hypothetical protein
VSAKKKRRKGAAPTGEPPSAPVREASGPAEVPARDAPSSAAAESLLERWAFGPVAAVRPYLASRFVLFLLAVDVWASHLGPAWRYGAAGFNVPHFDWVDRVLPAPTAVTYVGMLALVSAGGAIAASLARPPAWLVGTVAALYLWGWSSSMFDSYQHHYLLSWMLLVIAAQAHRPARELYAPAREAGSRVAPPIPRTHAWQYRLLTVLPAVVYLYTAISKLEPDWRSGDALRTLTDAGRDIGPFLDLLRQAGVEGEEVWPLLGAATIAIQVIVSLSYWLVPLADADAVATGKDAERRRWSMALGASVSVLVPAVLVTFATRPYALVVGPALLAAVVLAMSAQRLGRDVSIPGVVQGLCLVGFFAAVAFHFGAEDMGLEIGWFSWYMIGLAIVVLGPAGAVDAVGRAVTAPLRELDRSLEATPAPVVVMLAGVVCLVALAGLGDFALVPGAFETLAGVGAVVLVLSVASFVRPALARPVLELTPGVLLVAALAFFVLQQGQERFDYFRFAGGDFRRRGDVEPALEAYRHAVELAPDEQRDRIEARVTELEALAGE